MKDPNQILAEIKQGVSAAKSREELVALRTQYLGRHGEIASLMHRLKEIPDSDKPAYGALVNKTKLAAEEFFLVKESVFSDKTKKSLFDVTEPGLQIPHGSLHPITLITNQMVGIFERLGFKVATGPEIESDWYNFEALNIPPDHPARDTQDTFYVDGDLLLRTHTSPVQVRVMESEKPPIRVIVPGRVYRRDLDPTHTPMFNQIEGLLIDETTDMSELKGTLTFFIHQLFGKETLLRFRPHHFPFTEPSAEIDISCTICRGKGKIGADTCRVCKGSTWLEILGAGMVHPNVLKAAGIDQKRYRGFAFGTGIDRIAMLKYNIPDLRLLFENDLRFLEQF